MTRLLITGGSSYLGQHLVPLAREAPHLHDVTYTYFSHDPLAISGGRRLDLRDRRAVSELVDEIQPDVIIHTAGSNRPAETMDAVIRQGAAHITEAATAHGARLIHISSDVVFDGRAAPYRESDPPRPLHAYGRAKAAAEQTVADHPNFVIIRTSLIYGLHLMDRGTEWMVEALRAGRSVTLFTDQLRNPVWANTLSRACLELVHKDFVGVLHVAGSQQLSRAEFGQRMLDWWGITDRGGLSFGPCDGQRWPLDCTLDISLAERLLQTPLPGVDEVFGEA